MHPNLLTETALQDLSRRGNDRTVSVRCEVRQDGVNSSTHTGAYALEKVRKNLEDALDAGG